ncbi:MAG TPA: saccharopine dehydrogenase NADP-binding domain-containing protein [Candidatus Polarisedimenticolaceae bacterium]
MHDLDLVVWGATGYTGRLVAAEIARRAPAGFRWAVGGRDRSKLEALGLGAEIVVADAVDRASLDRWVGRARVVVSTVGPFAVYGTPLVEACVERGIAYADITGEPSFIRANLARLHERAEATGARIVHTCGFDSIPSDLGVFMLREHLRERHGRQLASAIFVLERASGGFSGGTAASVLHEIETGGGGRDARKSLVRPRGDGEGGAFAPFLMAPINTSVVRRSHGTDFGYEEVVRARSLLGAWAITAGIGAFVAAAATSPGRALLRTFLPRPGAGPTAEQRERGFFDASLRGLSDGAPPIAVRGRVAADADPGYGATALMLAESGLCLALDELPDRHGILTPASAMGRPLLDRLRRAGMTFEVTG